MQIMMGLPSAVGTVLQGMILFPMLAGTLFTEYRLRIIMPRKSASLEPSTQEVSQ